MGSTIAVLGLGTMGGRTAARAVEAGVTVHGYDPTPTASQAAQQTGVTTHPQPQGAVEAADVVLLSLPLPADVRAAAEGPLGAAQPGTVVVDMSTIDPGTARHAADVLRPGDVTYLDAPVLGRPDRCGHWTLVCGGPAEAIDRVRPLLESFAASQVVRAGDVGAGSVVKLLNNLVFGAINAVTAEAVDLCRRAGVDPATFVDTVAGSGAATVSPLFRELGPRLVAADYTPTFALDLLAKDNRLALELADATGSPAFVARCIDAVNALAVDAGLGRLDTGVVHRLYAEPPAPATAP